MGLPYGSGGPLSRNCPGLSRRLATRFEMTMKCYPENSRLTNYILLRFPAWASWGQGVAPHNVRLLTPSGRVVGGSLVRIGQAHIPDCAENLLPQAQLPTASRCLA